MEYIGGTDKALQLIKELEASGDLINFYTKEYFSFVNNDTINSKVFDDLRKQHGDKFIGHLLIGCFHDNEEKLKSLLYQYEPAQEETRWEFTCDCFAFINLKTQSILYMGITGRKRHYHEFIVGNEDDDGEHFEKLDHLGIVSEFRRLVDNDLAYNLNQLHYNGSSSGEYYDYVLGPNGRYHSEYDVEDIEEDSDDGFTREELDELIHEAEEREGEIKNAESTLQSYFPKFSTYNIYE